MNQANNLPPTVDPKFVAPKQNIYLLQPGSPAIDAGQVIPGITDGDKGKAPDEGAYESSTPAQDFLCRCTQWGGCAIPKTGP